METYDAPMLDTGDPDIAMYSGSSEMWLSVEASMADHPIDAHSHLHISQDHHTSIEVDMQDHNDYGITEYEMADGMIRYEVSGDDLLDVDVHDASRLHSPLVAPTVDASLFAPIEIPSILSTPLSHAAPLPQRVPEVPPVAESAPDHAAMVRQEIDFTVHSDNMPQVSIPGDEEPSSEHISAHEETSASFVIQEQHIVVSSEPISNSPIQVAPETKVEEVRVEDATSHVEQTIHEEQTPHKEHDNREEQPTLEEFQRSSEDPVATTHADDVTNEEDREQTAPVEHGHPEVSLAEPSSNHRAHHDEPSVVDDAQELTHHEAAGVHHDTLETTEEDAPKVTDPHEISDGIFIDPPPGVLLSLSSDEFPDYSLFNQPTPASGSQSPTETAADGDLALPLLLQSHPTLYYEPLSNVFQALHQEESLRSLAYFTDGEMVLDAYDLQLVISEVSIVVLIAASF